MRESLGARDLKQELGALPFCPVTVAVGPTPFGRLAPRPPNGVGPTATVTGQNGSFGRGVRGGRMRGEWVIG